MQRVGRMKDNDAKVGLEFQPIRSEMENKKDFLSNYKRQLLTIIPCNHWLRPLIQFFF